MAKEVSKFRPVLTNIRHETFLENWDLLMEPKTYDVPLFGGLLAVVMAYCIHLDLLLFECSLTIRKVFLVLAPQFAVRSNSPYPLVLCYLGYQYEGILTSFSSLEQLCSLRGDYLWKNITTITASRTSTWVKQVNKPIQLFSVGLFAICALPVEHLLCTLQSVKEVVTSKKE